MSTKATMDAPFDDAAMMEHPNRWPCWPILPLTRRNKTEMGVLIDGHGFRVFLANMFEGVKDDTPVLPYTSIDDILRDGWRVD